MSDARKNPAFGNADDTSMQIQSHPEEKLEQLRDKLADYIAEVDEESFDCDTLDAMLDELETLDPMPEFSDDMESLARFHQKRAAKAAAESAPTAAMISTSSSKKRSARSWLKILPVAAILVLLLGSVMAQAFGLSDLFSFIRWDSEVFQVGGEAVPHATITKMPLEEGEQATYDTLQEALDAFGIKEKLAPTELPERFELTRVRAHNKYGDINIYADYVDSIDEEGFLSIRYCEITSDTSGFEHSNPHVNYQKINGIKHFVMPELERHKAYWQNGEVACYLDGTVSQEEMAQIIESIYEEK